MHKMKRIFNQDEDRRQKPIPLSKTFEMCMRNLKNRRGRYVLIFISISVVVAFFVTTLSYQRLVNELRTTEDIQTIAVLQRAGALLADAESDKQQRDQMIWLLMLSGALCFVGVTNTMYMSVTERYQEIGTLKCLGALDGFVVQLYIIESFFIGLVGSAIGCIVGYLLTIVQAGLILEFGILTISSLFYSFIYGVPPALFGGTILTVMAAIYPTMAAARMKPVDAMRVEI